MGNRTGWTKQQYEEAVWDFIRDKEPLNKLLDFEKETGRQVLGLYVEMAMDWFNTDPPQTGFSYEDFPSKTLLIYGSIIQLLIGNGILQSRNRLNYNDGGITVAVSDKAGDYRGWIELILRQYQVRSDKIKKAINIMQGFSGTGPGDPNRFLDWWG